ncbi:MAG: hypothetical protein OSB21_14420 [Myxococcota bacterium]|nr:hypothetical protein [Myxococcota bacterium]
MRAANLPSQRSSAAVGAAGGTEALEETEKVTDGGVGVLRSAAELAGSLNPTGYMIVLQVSPIMHPVLLAIVSFGQNGSEDACLFYGPSVRDFDERS